MKRLPLAVVFAASLTGGACGGDPDVRLYDGNGYSFEYPGGWREVEILEVVPGREFPDVGIQSEEASPSDGVTLTVATGSEVTGANILYARDRIAADLDETFERVTRGPTRISVDGLPALRFEAEGVDTRAVRYRARVTLVFDGTTWYSIECDFTREHAEETERGCRHVEESFQIG